MVISLGACTQYMTDVLLRQRGRVVAVVGLAHLDGIERRWDAAMSGSSPKTVRA